MYIQARGNPRIKMLRRMANINSSTVNQNIVSAFTGPSSKELMNKQIDGDKKNKLVRCEKSICGD